MLTMIESLTRENERLQAKCLHLEIVINKRDELTAIETKKLTLATEALEKIEDSKDLIAASEAREALTKIKAVGE